MDEHYLMSVLKMLGLIGEDSEMYSVRVGKPENMAEMLQGTLDKHVHNVRWYLACAL